MAAMNTTIVSNVVKAAFHKGINETFAAWTEPAPYTIGDNAEQDIRVLMSVLAKVRSALVANQAVSDVPLQDRPRAGSQDSEEADLSAHLDEEERYDLLKTLAWEQAILHRRILSLEEQAKDESEVAGKKTADGGRIRFIGSTKGFQPYSQTWETWLADTTARSQARLAETPEDLSTANWLAKCEKAADIDIPLVSAQDAIDVASELVATEDIDAASQRAWDKLLEKLADLGSDLSHHERVMGKLNTQLAEASREAGSRIKSEMAIECSAHRNELKRHDWIIEKMLQATELLRHLSVPTYIIDSPQWRTEEARTQASAAQRETLEAQAQTLEIEAQVKKMKADMGVYVARQQFLEMQKQMAEMFAEQQAQLKAMKEAMQPAAPAVSAAPAAPTAPSTPTTPGVSVTTVVAPRVRFNIIGAGQKHR